MNRRSFVYVNAAVLLFGLAGLFAKWIHQPAIVITFGRVLFSSVALGLYMLAGKRDFLVKRGRDLILLICAGCILAVHWWAFLKSIQLSTVAIGTMTFSSFPLFVIFLEPLVFHVKLRPRDLVLALVILLGVMITVPEFSFDNGMSAGIAVGMVSALAYAVLTVMNKFFADKYSSTMTAFYEQATAAIVLLPFVIGAAPRPSAADLGLMLLLGVVMTALAHTMFIASLRELPARLAGICSSMETVYGILFALILLGEIPSGREIAGAVIIVGAVALAQLRSE